MATKAASTQLPIAAIIILVTTILILLSLFLVVNHKVQQRKAETMVFEANVVPTSTLLINNVHYPFICLPGQSVEEMSLVFCERFGRGFGYTPQSINGCVAPLSEALYASHKYQDRDIVPVDLPYASFYVIENYDQAPIPESEQEDKFPNFNPSPHMIPYDAENIMGLKVKSSHPDLTYSVAVSIVGGIAPFVNDDSVQTVNLNAFDDTPIFTMNPTLADPISMLDTVIVGVEHEEETIESSTEVTSTEQSPQADPTPTTETTDNEHTTTKSIPEVASTTPTEDTPSFVPAPVLVSVVADEVVTEPQVAPLIEDVTDIAFTDHDTQPSPEPVRYHDTCEDDLVGQDEIVVAEEAVEFAASGEESFSEPTEVEEKELFELRMSEPVKVGTADEKSYSQPITVDTTATVTVTPVTEDEGEEDAFSAGDFTSPEDIETVTDSGATLISEQQELSVSQVELEFESHVVDEVVVEAALKEETDEVSVEMESVDVEELEPVLGTVQDAQEEDRFEEIAEIDLIVVETQGTTITTVDEEQVSLIESDLASLVESEITTPTDGISEQLGETSQEEVAETEAAAVKAVVEVEMEVVQQTDTVSDVSVLDTVETAQIAEPAEISVESVTVSEDTAPESPVSETTAADSTTPTLDQLVESENNTSLPLVDHNPTKQTHEVTVMSSSFLSAQMMSDEQALSDEEWLTAEGPPVPKDVDRPPHDVDVVEESSVENAVENSAVEDVVTESAVEIAPDVKIGVSDGDVLVPTVQSTTASADFEAPQGGALVSEEQQSEEKAEEIRGEIETEFETVPEAEALSVDVIDTPSVYAAENVSAEETSTETETEVMKESDHKSHHEEPHESQDFTETVFDSSSDKEPTSDQVTTAVSPSDTAETLETTTSLTFPEDEIIFYETHVTDALPIGVLSATTEPTLLPSVVEENVEDALTARILRAIELSQAMDHNQHHHEIVSDHSVSMFDDSVVVQVVSELEVKQRRLSSREMLMGGKGGGGAVPFVMQLEVEESDEVEEVETAETDLAAESNERVEMTPEVESGLVESEQDEESLSAIPTDESVSAETYTLETAEAQSVDVVSRETEATEVEFNEPEPEKEKVEEAQEVEMESPSVASVATTETETQDAEPQEIKDVAGSVEAVDVTPVDDTSVATPDTAPSHDELTQPGGYDTDTLLDSPSLVTIHLDGPHPLYRIPATEDQDVLLLSLEINEEMYQFEFAKKGSEPKSTSMLLAQAFCAQNSMLLFNIPMSNLQPSLDGMSKVGEKTLRASRQLLRINCETPIADMIREKMTEA